MSSIPAELHRQVVARGHYRCAYYQSQQQLMGVLLTVDHIVPQSLGGATSLENLCLSCWDCNLIKGDRTTAVAVETGEMVRLFHPNQQQWPDHFVWNGDKTHIVGITAVGRATVTLLRLNRSQLVESRRFWVQAGWHPPEG